MRSQKKKSTCLNLSKYKNNTGRINGRQKYDYIIKHFIAGLEWDRP